MILPQSYGAIKKTIRTQNFCRPCCFVGSSKEMQHQLYPANATDIRQHSAIKDEHSSADKDSRRCRWHSVISGIDSDTSTSMTCAHRNQAAVSQNVTVTYSANLKATQKKTLWISCPTSSPGISLLIFPDSSKFSGLTSMVSTRFCNALTLSSSPKTVATFAGALADAWYTKGNKPWNVQESDLINFITYGCWFEWFLKPLPLGDHNVI